MIFPETSNRQKLARKTKKKGMRLEHWWPHQIKPYKQQEKNDRKEELKGRPRHRQAETVRRR